jgi:hypothetical protein
MVCLDKGGTMNIETILKVVEIALITSLILIGALALTGSLCACYLGRNSKFE